jgi:hypothetical protein
MKRRLFQIAAVVCLLFCGGTLALWASGRGVAVAGPAGTAWSAAVGAGSDMVWIGFYDRKNWNFNHWSINRYTTASFGGGAKDCWIRNRWGFGCTLSSGSGWKIYQACVPPWFLAILFLLLAYVFFRKSRGSLKAGHGFPVLSTPPKATP